MRLAHAAQHGPDHHAQHGHETVPHLELQRVLRADVQAPVRPDGHPAQREVEHLDLGGHGEVAVHVFDRETGMAAAAVRLAHDTSSCW